ncbi:MAG TPA: hypothetical protein VJK30_03080 [Coxiellaceae bacterium]|nr:MAG: hypothetical protein A3E81_03080 [Gammaproteobacteria bacterium RIFCSPHIGHO2_12_FULL_36_30]HLB56298.1 hypothetical protein [Coxiellaceae bacterium]
MKKQSILAVALTALIATGSAFAATAVSGYRIFNQDGKANYTTSSSSNCTGVTFPTSIKHGNDGVITVTSGFMPGSLCSARYTSSHSEIKTADANVCLVTITSNPADGVVQLYASPLSGSTTFTCLAMNGNTAIAIN